MKNILLNNSNNKIIIGIVLGIIIANIKTIILFELSLELSNMIFYFIALLYFISFALLELLIFINKDINKLEILEIRYDKNIRSLSITMNNENLLAGEDLFKGIYNTVINNKEFKDFGHQKIIILSCTLEDFKEYNIHSNVLIDNDTPFTDYYNEISNDLGSYNNLEYGYHNMNIIRFTIKAWNCSNLKNLKIKETYNAITIERSTESTNKQRISKRLWLDSYYKNSNRSFSTSAVSHNKHWYKALITPLSLYNKNGKLKLNSPNPIFTMDLETIKFDNVQVPIAISCASNNNSNLFIIDHILLINNKELALQKLWSQYFNYLENLVNDLELDKLTIFAHNLGDFDGYFLYKALMNHYKPDNISSIIDESNSFISIKYNDSLSNITFEWKDSLRVFPISLDKLCKVFAVEGKLTPYNPKFNSIELFNNPRIWGLFKKYSLQDSISLYNALYYAQFLYFNKFGVDIESIYSTATLSLKIFRTKFLDKDIFILPQKIDTFIRQGYFGGGTDVYKSYGKKLYYYDVNSLYPYAMLNPMPYDLINPKLVNLANRTLESFFGFAHAKINCPLNMQRPVLPFHYEGKTIYPVGNWEGVYFSEELKAVEKLGYKITLIKGYEFTKIDLFTKYVNTFYEIKRCSKGAEKMIAKLLLNNLYGYFGRKQINIQTQNIKNSELEPILLTKIVKSTSKINDEYSTVLSYTNINKNLLVKLNNELDSNIENFFSPIKSNVALAAAVTAYARIIMIPFKIDPNTLYTDTDSIFTTKPIDLTLLGDQLGQMKDEMNGILIEEGLFLGPKNTAFLIVCSSLSCPSLLPTINSGKGLSVTELSVSE